MLASALLDVSKALDSISHNLLLISKAEIVQFRYECYQLDGKSFEKSISKIFLQKVSSDWIGLYQEVPQGTILGPFLFNLYVNSLINTILKPCELVQYADNTFLIVANENNEEAICHLELNISRMVHFFQCHRLNLSRTKIEFIIFVKGLNPF